MTMIFNKAAYKETRKSLRNEMTASEMVLWQVISNRQIDGLRFRRQYGVERYILDFYCPSCRLAVEVDGSVHDDPEIQLKDRERDAFLLALGIRTIRFSNDEVLDDIHGVIRRVREAAGQPPPDPLLR